MSDDIDQPARDSAPPPGPVAIPSARFAAVCFEGAGRDVRRVVTLFDDARSADLFAVEQGWSGYTVAPASLLLSLPG